MSVSPLVLGIHLTSGFAESRRTGHISTPPIRFHTPVWKFSQVKTCPEHIGDTSGHTRMLPGPNVSPTGGVSRTPRRVRWTDTPVFQIPRRCRDCRVTLSPSCMWRCPDCVRRRIDAIRKGRKWK